MNSLDEGVVAMASVVTPVLTEPRYVASVLVVSTTFGLGVGVVKTVLNCTAIDVETSLGFKDEIKRSDKVNSLDDEVKRSPLEAAAAVEVGMITLEEVASSVRVDGSGTALPATMKALLIVLNKGIDEEDIMDDVTMIPQLGSVQLHSGP